MRTVRIATPTVQDLKKAIAFLATRNEGADFIPWETTKGFVDATPETLEQERELWRDLKAAGFRAVVLIPSDNAANLASIRAAIQRGARIVGNPAE